MNNRLFSGIVLNAAAIHSLIAVLAAAFFCLPAQAMDLKGPAPIFGRQEKAAEVSEAEETLGTAEKSEPETTPGMTKASGTDRQNGNLVLVNRKTGEEIIRYPVSVGDEFGIRFIHSVNKSPLTDYYEIREDGIYVVRTVYYNFGAGVQTELEGDEELTYGDDGSMIITGFDRKMDDLCYFVGTVSDHVLLMNGTETSLRELCGRNTLVRFSYESYEGIS